jgi:uncharacterized protein (DUF488 family)
MRDEGKPAARRPSSFTGAAVWTVGHGNRSIEELIGLLKEAGIECLVDVRAYPASRRHPQFSRDALEQSLERAGVRYVWEGKALGGRRRLSGDSPHVALRSPSFRAYADHMGTGEFRAALERALALAATASTAILCAERLPWECHRNLIADSLAARGVRVLHLMAPGESREHALNPVARQDGERLIYDAGAQLGLKL